MRLAFCLLALASVSVAAPAQSASTTAPALASALDSYAAKARADWNVPGLAVVAVRDGKTLLQRGYGLREIGKPAAVDERTVFNIGSSSKAFTTALLAQLVEEKTLGWDDPVARHLPDLKLPPYAPDVTIRDLASHRSGWGAASYNFIGLDRAGLLGRIQYLPQAASIRSKLVYNNLGYSVLGEVAAKASGSSWEELLRQRLFEPLGMQEAANYGDPLGGNAAAPHARIAGSLKRIQPLALNSVAPAGGIYASARDMAAWMTMLLAGGKAGDRQLLQPESIKLMQHMHMPLPVSGIARIWPSTHFYGYGLGWFVRDYRGIKVVEHGGNTAGISAFVLLAPELNFGVTVLANADLTDAPTAIAYCALDLAIGGDSPDVGATLLANQSVEEPAAVPSQPAALPLARYAGAYATPLYGAVRIATGRSGLTIKVNDDLHGKLVPTGEHNFDVVWSDPYIESTGVYSPLAFELGPDGTPQRLLIEKLSNPTPVFERQR